MHDPLPEAGQTAQRTWHVEIGQQGTNAHGAQFVQAPRAGGHRRQGDTAPQKPGDTQANVATTDQQYTLAAKSGRQGAEGGLV